MISFRQLKHYSIHATDDTIGGCQDVLFDDQDYVVRYLVADTNTWLPLSRKVVLSPISVAKVDQQSEEVFVNMTAQTLKDSPSIDEHKPVSREYEETLFQYFGYGYYWIGPGAWGDFAHPGELADMRQAEPFSEEKKQKHKENHLRSCGEVNGYDVATRDDDVGHITDFIIDAKSWAIKLVVVDTHNWLPGGKKLVIQPQSLEKIDWSSHKVKINMSHDELLEQPEIDTDRLKDTDYIHDLINKAAS